LTGKKVGDDGNGPSGGEPQNPASKEARLIRALGHSDRCRILFVLRDRVLSATDPARELDVELTHIGYHVRILHGLDLIVPERREMGRGSPQVFYKLSPDVLEPDAWTRIESLARLYEAREDDQSGC